MSDPTTRRIVRKVAAAAVVALFILQLAAIVQRAGRDLHKDEAEYLHAAWLMEHGERLYETFFEHHPPFLFAMLRFVAGDDVGDYAVRARLLSGWFALLATGAFCAILWRIRPEAAPIAMLLLFASEPLWLDGLVAARVEPFALAFFWCGTAAVLVPREDDARSDLLAGAGLALVLISALWTPKWPFSSAAVFAFWIVRTRGRMRSTAVAIVLALVAILLLRSFASFDRLWFFNVEFNRAFWPSMAKSERVLRENLQGGVSFLYGPVLLRPLTMAVVFVLVVLATATRTIHERRLTLFFLLLGIASTLELRFVFPWPALWPHYYVLWAFAGAALTGLVPAAVGVLLARVRAPLAEPVAIGVAALLLIVLGAHAAAVLPLGNDNGRGPYWNVQRYVAERLRPGDTVLVDVQRHPVAARDASYYWFGFADFAEELRRSPRGARFLPSRADLPFCAMISGPASSLRFVAAPGLIEARPGETQCFERLKADQRIRPTPFKDLYEVPR